MRYSIVENANKDTSSLILLELFPEPLVIRPTVRSSLQGSYRLDLAVGLITIQGILGIA